MIDLTNFVVLGARSMLIGAICLVVESDWRRRIRGSRAIVQVFEQAVLQLRRIAAKPNYPLGWGWNGRRFGIGAFRDLKSL